MPCDGSCQNRVTKSEAVIDNYTIASNSGNEVYNIPTYVGAPLSTACERATIKGSIPDVINFFNYTTVNGAVATSEPTMGAPAASALRTYFNNRRIKDCLDGMVNYGSNCCS